MDFASVALTVEQSFLDAIQGDSRRSVDGRIREAVSGELRRALEVCGATGDTHVGEGAAAAAVGRCADELEAELLVIGTHGRTGLARLALGSVADRVMRAATCPVIAVRLAHC